MARLTQQKSFVQFTLGDSSFALPLSMVEGVAALPEVVAVPGVPSRVMLGLAYVVGQIMTVVDVAPLFNLGSAEHAHEVLIMQAQGEYYAIKADAVGNVVTTSPAEQKKSTNEFSKESITVKDKIVRIIDTEKLVRKICS